MTVTTLESLFNSVNVNLFVARRDLDSAIEKGERDKNVALVEALKALYARVDETLEEVAETRKFL
tara:strand:+ start:362 stop:556 length:195 start_codon:yes stop_codon:yes gene_type:complete